jgi:mono/diheme cytochrome c family protein
MMAGEAQEAFKKVAEAANEGDATAALKTAGATCGACHTAHREKGADGEYTIKY